jgi:protein involved in polysaccharide export with SLBB domain
MADQGTEQRNRGVVDRYTVACPDVLDIQVAGRPELCRHQAIGPDGRINLGDTGSLRVEGRTPAEVEVGVAELLELALERVRVRVAEFKSREVYLAGPGVRLPRTVPYQGQETVLDLLKRVGGVTPSAAPEAVYVVRPHVTDGGRPEVFHVDLDAILLKHDQRTNVRLQPFDQVHVGETRQGQLDKCLPPLLRPLFQTLWGIKPITAPMPANSV